MAALSGYKEKQIMMIQLPLMHKQPEHKKGHQGIFRYVLIYRGCCGAVPLSFPARIFTDLIMNSLRKTMLFAQMGRRLATVETRASLSNSLKLKQERMQVPDGRPVHLKGGTTDTMLMQLTFLLCAIGLGSCFKVYYDLSVPKK